MFPSATTLWGSATKMLGYDIMLLSCEGSQYADVKMPFYGNVKALRRLGRPHLRQPPALQLAVEGPGAVAQHGGLHRRLEGGKRSAEPVDRHRRHHVPQGRGAGRLAGRASARPRRAARSQLYDPAHSVAQVTRADAALDLPADEPELTRDAQRTSTQYMTFNTPVEAAADAQCGRVVHTDIHVKAAPAAPGESKDKSDPGTSGTPFPTGCTSVTLSRAGEGAGVPVLRSVGLRAARHRPARAAAGPAARRAVDAAGRDARAAARSAAAAATAAAADPVAPARG